MILLLIFSGPHTWANNVEAARGKHQSPIDVHPAQAKFDAKLKECPLKMSYKPSNAQKLLNNGKSVQVVYDSADSSKSI